MNDSSHSKRWYDSDPLCRESIQILEEAPEVLQTLIAESVNLIAHREFSVGEMMRSYKSLGTDKVLHLHQSKSKRRGQDKNPAVHKTLNYLMVLSPKHRAFISHRIKQLYHHLIEYIILCKEISRPPKEEDLNQIVTVFTEQGDMEILAFMKGLKVALHRDIQNQVPLSLEEKPLKKPENEPAMDKERSMRIGSHSSSPLKEPLK